MKQLKPIFFLGLILSVISLFAQEVNSLTKSQQEDIIHKLATNLEEAYVFEDKGIEMSEALKKTTFSKDIEVFSKEVKNLNGNIGYIKITECHEYEEAFKVAAATMEFLKSSDAYIIDLRDNPGGSGKIGHFLASYFFEQGDDRIYLTDYCRKTDELTQGRILFDIPGERRPEKPLYIVINKNTGSAAEAFAYAMQAYKKAIIVGKPYYGGAHSGDDEPLAMVS